MEKREERVNDRGCHEGTIRRGEEEVEGSEGNRRERKEEEAGKRRLKKGENRSGRTDGGEEFRGVARGEVGQGGESGKKEKGKECSEKESAEVKRGEKIWGRGCYGGEKEERKGGK